jgi:hypothetical protein
MIVRPVYGEVSGSEWSLSLSSCTVDDVMQRGQWVAVSGHCHCPAALWMM